MKPYYEQDGISLFHGDCRECLLDQDLQERIEPVSVLVTDPPYQGLAGNLIAGFAGGSAVAKRRTSTPTVGEAGRSLGFIRHEEWLPLACDLVVGGLAFCSYHDVAEVRMALPLTAKPKALIVWHKPNSMPVARNVPRFRVEFAWAFQTADPCPLAWRELDTLYSIPSPNAGCVSSGERYTNPDGRATHPAQKPITLMQELLALGGDLVLDPFAGTGTTLHAAKNLGRKAIGIEIEERYCEIAARRLDQGVLDLGA